MESIEKDIKALFQLMTNQKGFNNLVFMKKRNPVSPLKLEANESVTGISQFMPTWYKNQKQPLFSQDLKLFEQLLVGLENENTNTYLLKKSLIKKGIFYSRPLKFEAFHWGYIVCFFDLKQIEEEVKNCIETFSEFICKSMYQQYKLNKTTLDLKNTKKNLLANGKVVESLKDRIAEKNEQIASLKNKKVDMAEVMWKEENLELDEVWLTMQGYVKEKTEPVISKWCKIEELELYNQLNNLLQFKQLKKVRMA